MRGVPGGEAKNAERRHQLTQVVLNCGMPGSAIISLCDCRVHTWPQAS